MRLVTAILIATILHSSAAGFGQKITLFKKNSSLKEIILELHNQSGYDFVTTDGLINTVKPITINVSNLNFNLVLEKLFTNQPISYTISDKTVILKAKENFFVDTKVIPSSNLEIRGTIKDENGKPLSGATVRIKDTNKIVKTNSNGEFYFSDLSAQEILQISFLGYKTKEVVIGNSKDIQISLEVSPAVLQEVSIVSNGYQALPKERTAGSFAKPDMSIVQNRTGSMNIIQRLDGLISGLTINNAPSAGANPVLVRGLSTIGVMDNSGVYSGTNRNPLFVVDGIPLDDISRINPQDVADITVLKDATAASIWGARASNGVIVITTKKGANDDKLRITYDAFVNFQGKPDLDYFKTLNSGQFITAAKETFDPITNTWASVSGFNSTGASGIAPHELILYNLSRNVITAERAKGSLDSLSALDNRQQIKDIWYRNASLMNHTISFSAGASKYSFYGSAAYTNTLSDRHGEKDNTYKVNLRQDMSIGKFVQLNLITDLSNNIYNTKRNIEINNNFYPYQLFKDGSGNNISIPYMGNVSEDARIDFQDRSRVSLDYNPLDEFNYGYTKDKSFLSRNVLGLNVKIVDGLKFEGIYGYVKRISKTEMYDDSKSYLVRNELVQFTVAPTIDDTPEYYLPNTGGRYSIANADSENWTIRNQLSYNKSWNDNGHQLTALVGQEAQDQLFTTNKTTLRGYNELLQTAGTVDYRTLITNGVENPVMPNFYDLSLLPNDLFNKSELNTRFTSYYANLAYTYAQKYTINGSYRNDKSNLFGLDKSAQNKPVWSTGAKWLASSESFLSEVKWLNNLALRATYGITGNSPAPGSASSYDILAARQGGNFPGGVALNISTPSNQKLTWETTKTVNIGLDFGVINNRITGSVDVYRKRTTDLLGILPTNTFSGYSSITGNFGDMENKGLELSLNTLNIKSNNFKWNTSFNISYNKNTITKLNLSTPVTTPFYRIRQSYAEGYPAFALFGYKFAGLDNLGDPKIQLADGSVTKELNVAGLQDLVYLGTYQPVWSGGLSNIFNYKNLTFSANAIFNLGHVMRKDVNQRYTNRITHSNVNFGGFTTGNLHSDFANRWKQPGDENNTNVPAYVSNSSLSETRRDVEYYTYSDINVVNASYVKLRDITLAYNLPNDLIKKLKVEQCSFRIQLSNLMLWKANNDGIDPEFHNAEYATRNLPLAQGSLSFGLNIKF